MKGGSVKNKIVAQELLEERANLNFDKDQAFAFFNPMKDVNDLQDAVNKLIDENPDIQNTHKVYEMTREELFQHKMKVYNRMA